MSKVGYAKLTDYNRIFDESNNPMTISCHIPVASDFSQEMSKHLFGHVKTMSFDLSASCACGKYVGNCYTTMEECPFCHSKISSIFCRDLEFKGWIIVPKFLPKLLHPQTYVLLSKWLWLPSEFKNYKKRKKLTALDWLLDPSLPIKEIWPELDNGLDYFYNNFDRVLDYLLALPKNRDKHELRMMLNKYRDRIWMDKIPVINEFLHLVTQYRDDTKFQVDESAPLLYETYSSLCSIVNDDIMGKRMTQYSVNRRMYNIQREYVDYCNSLIDKKLLMKPGLIRKSVVSGRLHYTARAVIVPTVTETAGDEITVPWEIFLINYESFILNYLTNRYGFEMMDAVRYHKQAVYQPDDILMNAIVAELFVEVKVSLGIKGFPALINRNPSVHHGATQQVFIVGVTKDRVIAIPPLIVAAPNADYDRLFQGSFLENLECFCHSRVTIHNFIESNHEPIIRHDEDRITELCHNNGWSSILSFLQQMDSSEQRLQRLCCSFALAA